jgi:hypothetical protein
MRVSPRLATSRSSADGAIASLLACGAVAASFGRRSLYRFLEAARHKEWAHHCPEQSLGDGRDEQMIDPRRLRTSVAPMALTTTLSVRLLNA